jgi:DNA helicase-2/ATP-dependent DNA helicase PcrA
LDDEQRAAAMAEERFVRVRAGAGTGKTTCLVARVRYLLQVKDVAARDVCVVTFGKRAAEEIARRVGQAALGAFVGTVHSLGYRILQFERMGRPIADDRKAGQLIFQALKTTGCRDPLTKVKARIIRARTIGHAYPPGLVEVGQEYERILHDVEQKWDFADLIHQPTLLLATDAVRHQKWLRRFAHIIVDEAQDTSTAQWDLLQHLVGVSTSLYVVGDPGQSIYVWRGAQMDGMLSGIEERFGGEWAEYTIAQNYRSHGDIITAANRVLHGKPEHVLVAQARLDAQPILPIVVGGTWRKDLAPSIEQSLLNVMAAKIPPQDVVVLGRTHAVLGEAEAICVKLGVPYLVAGGFSFYDRTEIKDVMAYLEYAAGVDKTTALDRFYNRPSRYLGKVWLESLYAQGGWVRWESEGPPGFRWSQKYMADRCAELWAICQQLKRFGPDAPVLDVLHYVLNGAVGYRAWMRADGLSEQEATEDNDAEENLKALVSGAAQRDQTVGQWVAFVDQCRHQPRRVTGATGAVTLSTIHRAKGLEWPVVVLVGLEEGILPHARGEAEGEERRLYYVAVSRARDALVLALSGDPESPVETGLPSRYVLESMAAMGLTDVLPLKRQRLEDGDAGVEYLPPPVALLPAPTGDADSEPAGDRSGDGVHRADGVADRSAGPILGSPGTRSTGDGKPEAGDADYLGSTGVCGDVEAD